MQGPILNRGLRSRRFVPLRCDGLIPAYSRRAESILLGGGAVSRRPALSPWISVAAYRPCTGILGGAVSRGPAPSPRSPIPPRPSLLGRSGVAWTRSRRAISVREKSIPLGEERCRVGQPPLPRLCLRRVRSSWGLCDFARARPRRFRPCHIRSYCGRRDI